MVLQEDVNMGLYSVTVIEGEDALDPASPSLGALTFPPFHFTLLKFTSRYFTSRHFTLLNFT